jgi:excisionase family DNA binding protein
MLKPKQAAVEAGEPLRAYTPKYVAEAASLHEETIRSALRTGRLPGVRFGAHWRITHGTLVALMRDGLPAQSLRAPADHSADGANSK